MAIQGNQAEPLCTVCHGTGRIYEHVQDDTGKPCWCVRPASPVQESAPDDDQLTPKQWRQHNGMETAAPEPPKPVKSYAEMKAELNDGVRAAIEAGREEAFMSPEEFWDTRLGKTRGRPHARRPFTIQLIHAWAFAAAYLDAYLKWQAALAPTDPQPTPAGETLEAEREEFEKWITRPDLNLSVQRDRNGEYISDDTDSAWLGWYTRSQREATLREELEEFRLWANCGGISIGRKCVSPEEPNHEIYGPHVGDENGGFWCEFHWFKKQIRELEAALQVVYAAAAVRAEERERQWISVKERLPDKDAYVIVRRSNEHLRIDVEWYYRGDRYSSGFFDDGEMDTNVTHWMPLPEPPAAIRDSKP